jgi:hypothetical protein
MLKKPKKENIENTVVKGKMEVVRLHCEHLPDVPILGIGAGASRVYLTHAQNLVSLLKGNLERTGACRAFNTFLQSTAGRVIKEQGGGELTAGSLPLDKMMYSYRVQKSGRGSASRFVTLEGAKEIVQKLPGVSNEMKAKLSPFLESDVMSFEEVTPEQCEKEDAHEEIEEICTGGSGGGFNGDAEMSEQTSMVSWKALNEYRVSLIKSEAERKYLQGRLELEEERKRWCQASKDTEIELAVAKERASMVESVAKERFEREKLQQQTAFLQEKASYEARMKELELANLRMQLERRKTRKSANGEGGSSSGGSTSRKRAQESALETEDDEEVEEEEDNVVRVARAAKVKLPPTSIGTKLYWLVVYEGEVEVTFDNLHAKLPDLSKIESARFNDRWYALLNVSRRIRSKPIMKAMHAMGIAGRVWVEAGHGCEQWVGFDIPECDVHAPSSSSEEIVKHMMKNQRAPARFAMVVVKE